MKFLLLFLMAVAILLWCERFYWKRRAGLLEDRLLGKDRSESVKSFLDAWLDGRIESRLRKEQRRKST
jgi:hypothetical protein